ncbi:hypothetical protein SEPCBS57363_003194 [Sporothrix epigloea]|uniref:AMP-activated protein kinase glycogen-binding domain-containing protein n=1 Tax=Sporothrix epigloea TaxID=1892477 RepID=A0ABP0DNT8_9PEZI
MAKDDVAVEITYNSTELQPPLWVAGTFSNPPWTPSEMLHRTTANGESIFSKTIHVRPGTLVQYKFRIGSGDWWVLDESQPTIIDETGNRNNLLRIEDSKSVKMHSPPTPPPDSPIAQTVDNSALNSQVPGDLIRSNASTPGFVRTTMEVADTAARIDAGTPESSASKPEHMPDSSIDHLNLSIGPEFPHERPGEEDDAQDGAPVFEYEFAGTYDRPLSAAASEASPLSQAVMDDELDFDPADPTLERFPSRREEILKKVRNLETGLDEDVATFEGYPASPVVSLGRKGSIGRADATLDSFSLSPASPRQQASCPLSAHRDSLVLDPSPASSLQCIVEETTFDDRKEQVLPETNEPEPGSVSQKAASAETTEPEGLAIIVHRATEDRDLNAANETNSAAGTHPGAFPQSDNNDPALDPAIDPQSGDDLSEAQHRALAENDSQKGVEAGEYYNRFMALTRFVFVDWLGGFIGTLFRWRRHE